MPRIEDVKPQQNPSLQRVPSGFAWPIIRMDKHVNAGGEVVYDIVTKDDDNVEQPAHHVRYLRRAERAMEAVANGEVVYLTGGWIAGDDGYDGSLIFA